MRCSKIYLFLITILGLANAELMAQLPVITIEPSGGKNDFCVDQTITLTARINLSSDEVNSITWDGDFSLIDKKLGDVLILKLKKPGLFNFTVYVNDIYGNKHTGNLTIRVFDVIKPVLKLEENKPALSLKDTKLLGNVFYYIDNREVSDEEFKTYTQPGTYRVIAITKNGCTASSNPLVYKKK